MRFRMTAGLVAMALAGLFLSGTGPSAGDDKTAAPKLWPLEGELKVHPKYLYRYYIVFGDGQKCGLYGQDHRHESELLKNLQPGARIRVRGVLGTEYHAGGTKENLSPFAPAWILYMDVHEAEKLKQ